ncbi:Na+/H+ antiporter subunit E [Deinococcus sp. YIM 77859]|uniref:Na+/H+ antiporter subunit E n=1 Tax=Deinococcus sp. YIM 77859 TaxID=1540221 RepID=UPI000554C20B|nr:Na+/H+ antiporter subunit E [Deinococcus sp. YIM 77859]
MPLSPLRSAGFHLCLALVWALFLGEVSLRTLALGYLVGFLPLALFHRALGTTRYVRSVLGLIDLSGYFVRELIRANVSMAFQALRPRPNLNPMIISVRLQLEGDTALTLLASITGLMPGTVALGFSPDRQTMYVHAAGMADVRSARSSIWEVERRLLRVFQPQDLPENRG